VLSPGQISRYCWAGTEVSHPALDMWWKETSQRPDRKSNPI